MARAQAPLLEPKNDSLIRPPAVIAFAAAADAAAVKRLLAECRLPVEDVADDLSGLVVLVAREKGVLCAAAALQPLGKSALLRSVAVAQASRGRGLARALCEALVAHARALGLARLYLLTTGAAEYFARLGFERIDRAEAPPELRASAQFAALCPASAAVMRRVIR